MEISKKYFQVSFLFQRLAVSPKIQEEPIMFQSPGKGEGDVIDRLTAVKSVLLEEYQKKHKDPWIVAYSGGKDSTLLLHLVFDMLQKTPKLNWHRHIHIVANDTLVESPPVINHLYNSLAEIRQSIKKWDLPMSVTVTKPCIDDTFWVNVIGRGYIPPTRNFRWCTDRMKIAPTVRHIKKIAGVKRAVLLIGTRKAESQNRKRRMEKHKVEHNKMSRHTMIHNCRVFSPLTDLTDDDVWMVLLQNKSLWGGTHRKLITLYRNAGGGECPLVLSKDDAPSCGTTSPRFGCWTCTVVSKDRSLAGLIDSGMDELEPLYDFRAWLLELREDNKNRSPYRRDGMVKSRQDGSPVYGPFTLDVRQNILHKLEEIEKELNMQLLSATEKEVIESIWGHDRAKDECRTSLLNILNGIDHEHRV